jgi:hypothetical protein
MCKVLTLKLRAFLPYVGSLRHSCATLTKMSPKGTFGWCGGSNLSGLGTVMARRGSNSFRRNDVMRAIKSARDAGLDPSMMEVIVGADGAVTFRVYGEKAAPLMGVAPENEAGARAWEEEIAKLKAKPKPKGR